MHYNLSLCLCLALELVWMSIVKTFERDGTAMQIGGSEILSHFLKL